MAKKEIMLISKENIATLKNKDLRNNLNTMLKAMDSANKSMWQYAVSITNIVNGALFNDDFESQTDFAKYINVSKATISQYKMAVAFMTKHPEYNMDKGNYKLSVAHCVNLSTLEDFDDFKKYVSNIRGIITEIDDMPAKKVRTLVSEYKKYKESGEVVATLGDSKENKKDKKEDNIKLIPSDSNKDSVEMVEITFRDMLYRIPRPELEKWRVKEDEKEVEA